MVGWIVLEQRGGLTHVAQTALCGLPVLRAALPLPEQGERALLRRVDRAGKQLARAGCRRVLTAADFPFWERLRQWGLHPVDPAPLYRVLAAPLALAALEQRGILPQYAVIALQGLRVSRPLFQAAEILCPRVRRLIISAPAGGAALARYLREEYGMPALEAGAERPDVTLCFAAELPFCANSLRLCAPAPSIGDLALHCGAIPAQKEIDSAALLALLWEEGRITLREIEILPERQKANALDR